MLRLFITSFKNRCKLNQKLDITATGGVKIVEWVNIM